MNGKAKLESLINAWYGFMLFSTLVNLVSAVLGAGFFAFLAVPFVIGISLFAFFISWAIGKLLLARSSLTRFFVLVLSPFGILSGGLAIWRFLTNDWTFSGAVSALLVGCGTWMHLRTMGTLLDKNVKSYFN
jgi:hypothetical protein